MSLWEFIIELFKPKPSPIAIPIENVYPLKKTQPIEVGSTFEKALAIVLDHEGGYTNDPSDSGGATNYGITQHDLAVHRGHPVSPKDVKDMSVKEAADIYLKNYWRPHHLDELKSFKIAAVIFDQGVLCGPHTAIKLAQRACGVPEDGAMGPMTIAQLNSSEPVLMCNKILDLCDERYEDIVHRIPKNQKFLKGWKNRVASLRAFITHAA